MSASVAPDSTTGDLSLAEQYLSVREQTKSLAAPIRPDDQVVQTMDDVSPTKWHLAHTTWFFETFVACVHDDSYERFRDGFDYLFNSYYQGAGPQFDRPRRGTLGRPTIDEIDDYRRHVDTALTELFDSVGGNHQSSNWKEIVEVGLQHEQQHQELLLTDIKHVLASNPLRPIYRADCAELEENSLDPGPVEWAEFGADIYRIGHEGPGFCFDNERPRHRVFLEDFRIATRPVSCGEFAEFIADGGYDDSRLWLAEGWQTVQSRNWRAPLYWEDRDGEWWTMTLGGMRPVDSAEPVCHISYFEADAFARWADARLPTEAQWEIASRQTDISGNFADTGRFHPAPIEEGEGRHGYFGDVWEWTSSAYAAYPGFQPWEGTLGEYNGKFMCNQYVLRGGSCATAQDHIRRSYRNFFPPGARWQFTGFRLAQSIPSTR